MNKTGEISEANTPPEEDEEGVKNASPKALENHPSRRLEKSISEERKSQQPTSGK